MEDHDPEYVLNTSVTNMVYADLDNTTSPMVEELEFQLILKFIRDMYIKELYGEKVHINFIITLTVCILGYITNGLNIAVFSRTQLSNPMNRVLLTLAIADLLHITTQISHIIHYFTGFPMYPYYEWYFFTIFNTFFETATSFVCNWLIVIIGIWITSIIRRPLMSTWLTTKSVTIITILLVCFGIALGLPIFLQMTYQAIHFRGHVLYEVVFTTLAKSKKGLFLKIYWSALLLRALVPVLIVVVITCLLSWNLVKTCLKSRKVAKKSSSSIFNFKTTVMVSLLLLLFLISNLPDACLMLVALITDGDITVGKKYSKATEIIRLFMLGNNAVTFFVYFALGVEFRRTFRKLFCCAKVETERNSEGNEMEKVEEATI